MESQEVIPSEFEGLHLDTSDPNALRFSFQDIHLTVLGGIRPEGLDRFRVTLKIEHTDRLGVSIRHNLDLYNSNMLEKLVRRVSERMEIKTGEIAAALNALTDKLEVYRLSLLSESDTAESAPKLSDHQIREAKKFLSSPELLMRTNEKIGQSGVIGEPVNRLLMYLIFTSRKTSLPLHAISLGVSGSGKTYLQESVGRLIPEEDRIEITTLSDNAFYYFGQQELKNKLILIEDLDGVGAALYPLRELQSKKKIRKTIALKDNRGRIKTTHLTVEGPVSVAGCTTRESIYEDNANRSFLIYLDSSSAQDERIMEYQRSVSAGLINQQEQLKAMELLQNCQRQLRPTTVRNPYAPYLKIPRDVFKPRRSNSHYLGFIEAVTFYHQYQRPVHHDPDTGESYIETTLEDIQAANHLLKDVLLRKSDELSGACRQYLQRLSRHLKGQEHFKNAEVRKALRIHPSNQKRWTKELVEGDYLKRVNGSAPKGYVYRIIDPQEFTKLKKRIHSALDRGLEAAKALSGGP